jgi:hypothetical protein
MMMETISLAICMSSKDDLYLTQLILSRRDVFTPNEMKLSYGC